MKARENMAFRDTGKIPRKVKSSVPFATIFGGWEIILKHVKPLSRWRHVRKLGCLLNSSILYWSSR